MATSIERAAARDGIGRFKVRDLLLVRNVLEKMVNNSALAISDAYAQAADELKVDFDKLKSVEMSVRKYLKEELDITYVDTAGTKYLKVTESVKENAEAIERSLSKIDTEIKTITGLSSLSTDRKQVKVATILSVIHYLGPALTRCLQSREAAEDESQRSQYVCPHIELIYGEIDDHLRMLQSKQVDFVIGRNADISLANSLDVKSIRMKGKTRGIVFRYKAPGGRIDAFPQLVEALRDDSAEKFLAALAASPMILLTRIPTQAPDRFVAGLTDLVKKCSGSAKQGPRISVPTARSERQFVQMGCGVGVGHKPLHETNKAKKADIHRLGASIGRDPECPDVDLVYVPFEGLGLDAPDAEPTTFALYYRRKRLGLDRGDIKNADLTAEAIEVINEVVAITDGLRGNFGVYQFDSDGLMHDFHYAANSAFNYVVRAGKWAPLPNEKQFANPGIQPPATISELHPLLFPEP